jgi:hypothetical protein
MFHAVASYTVTFLGYRLLLFTHTFRLPHVVYIG